jgi:methylmalonyl-CoA/ethylmalonyl-CoA epimerase
MTESLGLGRIVQIAISVRDMARGVRFYRDVVGLTFLFEAPNVAFFDCAGIRLMLGQAPASAPAPGGTYLYFDSADIERDHRVLVERGAGDVRAPHVVANLGDKKVWLAELTDPDGNVFSLMQLK